MRRKADDHKASHSNCVNQFMHLISSTIFIFNYYTIWGDCTTTMVLGFFSPSSASRATPSSSPVPRRGGTPPRVQHPFQVLRRRGYTLAPIVTLLQLGTVNFVQALCVAKSWLMVTMFFVLGHTGLLWMQYASASPWCGS